MKVYSAGATCLLPEIVADLTVGNPLEKRIVFCEDKFTLALEQAIAKKSGGTFGTNVYSFNRYMHKHLTRDEHVLSTEGCSLVVKGLLLRYQKQLVCFKNVYDPNLASTIYELIAQLKSAKVTPSDIKTALDSSSGNLHRKLQDLFLLFSEYENYINQSQLTDGNNRLARLPEHFSLSQEIKQTKVIVAGFPSLNRTLCEIFKALINNAKSIDFVVVAGENSGVYTNETFNFITANFDCEVCKVPVGEERARLLNGLYSTGVYLNEGEYSNKIFLYKAKDLNEEIEHVAQLIKARVVEGGAKYKDFAICAEDLSGYEQIIARVFADYDIPFFLDVKKDLGKHPLTRLVCSYIDTVRRGLDISDLLAFVKNSLFTPDKSISDGFEDYCLRNSINRRSIKLPFTGDDENIEEYEKIRKIVIEVCGYLEKGSSVKSAYNAINRMLERVNAYENLLKVGDMLTEFNRLDLSAYNDQSDQKFISASEDIVSLLGDLHLSLVEIKNLILSGMTACKVSIIPEYNDCVFVGDFRSVRYNKTNTIFAIGLTDGVPLSKIDSALLCDRDIAKMEKAKVLVEPKIKEVNRRARECACMALASFTNQLYLSYPEKLFGGEEGKPSQIFDYVLKIFSDKEHSSVIFSDKDYRDLAQKIGGQRLKNFKAKSYLSERSAVFSFAKEINAYKEGLSEDFECAGAFYKYAQSVNKQEIVDGILTLVNSEMGYYTSGVNYAGEGLSATAIEGYFICPYANFLSRGVKLQERAEVNIKVNDLGTMVHEVGETFIRRVNWQRDDENSVQILAEKVFKEISLGKDYKRYQNSEGGKRSFELIQKEAIKFCVSMFNAGKHSKLKPKYLEVYFGGNKFPAIKVKTKYGEKRVTGMVDRIDSDGKHMAVIDYKTGAIDAREVKLYSGQKLQLYLYAKAFSSKYKPIGAYYFPVSNEFVTQENFTKNVLVGRTSSERELAKLVDDSLAEKDKGEYVNANLTLTSKGEFRYGGGLLSEKEFKSYMEYAQKVAGVGLEEICDGVIIPSPYENACEWCKYHGVCSYNEELDGRTRSLTEVKKIDILRATGHEKAESNSEKAKTENNGEGGNG